MFNPNRSRRKRYIFPMILLITLATILLAGYGTTLAARSALLPPLYLPLIFRNAGNPVVGTSTSTPTATGTVTATPTQTSTPTQTLAPTPTVIVGPGNVLIVDFAFQPAAITIHVGEKVEWENTGAFNHTTTSDTLVWDSGQLAPNEKFSLTFTSVGDYHYHCSNHPDMKGIIHVVLNP
jgi:plastocyanin